MRRSIIITTALLLCAPLPAAAAPDDAGASDGPGHLLLAYGKVGGLFPVSKLEPHASFRLGAGYAPPVLDGRLAVVVDLGYSQTHASETVADPRLGDSGADFSYELTQHDLNLFVGPQYFILDPRNWLVPYAALGLDLHFLRSTIVGTGGGQQLGENRELSTKAGFALRAGAGYRLGPGIITAELTFSWAPIDHDITGESHLGRLALLVGYTALLGF